MITKSHIEILQSHLERLVCSGHIVDFAMLGKASDIYKWDDTMNAEVDVLIVVDEMSRLTGLLLNYEISEMKKSYECELIDMDFRIIRGPYKNIPYDFTNDRILIHACVVEYRQYARDIPNILRWSWRKYKCYKQKNWLLEMCGSMPISNELTGGEFGVYHRLFSIKRGWFFLHERLLPYWDWVPIHVHKGHGLFVEYCISSALDVSRNHGRILKLQEADSLSNGDYVEFYRTRFSFADSLRYMMDLKNETYVSGHDLCSELAQELAIEYLENLINNLPV